MDYHNCIGNLWFMSRAANIGGSKGSKDFIDWLEKHEKFGDDFFDWAEGIDRSRILLTKGDGTILADAAHEYY
jgi:hypothetical protein